MSDSSTIPGSPADEWANDGLAKLWAFLQAHGFEVLALIVLYMYLRPMMRNYFERKHREAVMKRATGVCYPVPGARASRRVYEYHTAACFAFIGLRS